MKFAPSLMCMDYLNVGANINILNKYFDMLHVDIMDGHYAKNFALTPALTEAVCRVSKIPVDCHLMTTEPTRWIPQIAKSGVAYISPHAETINSNAFQTMNLIHDLGCKTGIVINPATPLSDIEMYLSRVDLLTIMTVDIGFAGQAFIDEMYKKIHDAKKLRDERDYHYEIQIDGHCFVENYAKLDTSGADILIVGNAGLFSLDEDLETACKKFHNVYEQCIA